MTDNVSKLFGWKEEIWRRNWTVKVGETYYDPNSQMIYEYIRKLSNGESITKVRSEFIRNGHRNII